MNRRRAIAGLAVTGTAAAAGLAEWRNLQGDFDHRRLRAPDGVDAWNASLARLDAEADTAAGAFVHVGQSTHLLSIAGARLLTDPWFYDPSFGALSHEIGPAIAPDGIGRLDVVLITHDHPDHFDPVAVDRLDKRALAIVATKELMSKTKRLGFRSVELLEPWQSYGSGDPLKITAVPAVHDIYEIGFVVEGAGRSVYFAGDTRLHADLPAIAERFAPTAAILPVDGTRLAGSKDLWVMTPEDACEAARILKVKLALPSHADAYFSDKLVAGARLATTIAGAPGKFVTKMRELLPGVGAASPQSGELVLL